MEDGIFSQKTLFYGELVQGKQPAHKPSKRFKDVDKCNLNTPGVNAVDRETIVGHRSGWRKLVWEHYGAEEN